MMNRRHMAVVVAMMAVEALAEPLDSPAVERAEIRMPSGKTLVIEAKDASRSRYVEGVAFNGRAVNANWLSAADLAKGGRLVFRMSSKPVKTRGTTLAAAPYSMSKDEKK